MENNIRIYCLKYAESVLPERMVFCGGDREKKIPISFAIYLIRFCDRNILVDAGCDTMPGFAMKDFRSPADVLKQMGIAAGDITDVVITHAHHDHIEAIKHFSNAVVHISNAEYESGKSYIPNNRKVNIFEKEYCLAPQIKIIEYGGHSKGSAIVEIATAEAIYVIAGDECYTDANIERKICTGSFFNQEKAAAFVEKYNDKKYRVYTSHDISIKTERIL